MSKPSPSDDLPTINGEELWRKYGPQTLQKANDFIGRVVKVEFETGLAMKKVVQQTLVS